MKSTTDQSIVRHPDFPDRNPLELVPAPKEILKELSRNDDIRGLRVLVKALRSTISQLMHPDPKKGLGIQSDKLGEINAASADITKASDEELAGLLADYLSNLDNIRDESVASLMVHKNKVTQRQANLTNTRDSALESFRNFLKVYLQNKAVPENFQIQKFTVDKPNIDDIKAIYGGTSNQTAANTQIAQFERIMLQGKKNPFDNIPIDSSLLTVLLGSGKPHAMQLFLTNYKRVLLRTLHPDSSDENLVELFQAVSGGFDVLETLTPEQMIFLAKSSMDRKIFEAQKELAKLGDEVSLGRRTLEEEYESVARLTKILSEVMDQFSNVTRIARPYIEKGARKVEEVSIGRKKFLEDNEKIFEKLSGRYYILPTPDSLKDECKKDSIVVRFEADGLLTWAPFGGQDDIDTRFGQTSEERLATLPDLEEFRPMGVIMGSVIPMQFHLLPDQAVNLRQASLTLTESIYYPQTRALAELLEKSDEFASEIIRDAGERGFARKRQYILSISPFFDSLGIVFEVNSPYAAETELGKAISPLTLLNKASDVLKGAFGDESAQVALTGPQDTILARKDNVITISKNGTVYNLTGASNGNVRYEVSELHRIKMILLREFDRNSVRKLVMSELRTLVRDYGQDSTLAIKGLTIKIFTGGTVNVKGYPDPNSELVLKASETKKDGTPLAELLKLAKLVYEIAPPLSIVRHSRMHGSSFEE